MPLVVVNHLNCAYFCQVNLKLNYMKKAILFLLAAGSFAGVQAQYAAPQAGSILAYGDAGFSTVTDFNKDKTLSWNFTPGIGYQFNDNMTAGLNLSWAQLSTQALGAPDPTVLNTYMAGAFFRYTHPFSNTFFAFAQFNGGYTGTYTTMGAAPATGRGDGYYANIMPAIGVHVGKGFALNFAFGHIGYRAENSNPPVGPSMTRTEFDFTFGQQFNIGVSKNFSCRKSSSREPMGELRNLNIDED